jgi:hypothetical protein
MKMKSRAIVRAAHHALWMLGAVALVPAAHGAVLSYASYAQVYGYIYSEVQSTLIPGLSTTQLNFPLPSDYLYSSSTATLLAQKSITIDPGKPTGADVVYDLVTDKGQYGFAYSGSAQVLGSQLKTQVETSRVDASGLPTDVGGSSNIYAWSYANWDDQWLIQADDMHAAGSYGAVLIGIKLDGSFPNSTSSGGSGYGTASLTAESRFTDSAGVSYQSSFGIYADSYDPSWTGASTAYKKLLFQYGTAFNVRLWQQVYAGSNSSADFFNTGAIESVELPLGTTLESGYLAAGGSLSDYGTVFNSATADAQNTTWDFGNNGGGFTPNVPEPESLVLALAGLGLLGGWRLNAHAQAKVPAA